MYKTETISSRITPKNVDLNSVAMMMKGEAKNKKTTTKEYLTQQPMNNFDDHSPWGKKKKM